MAKTKNPPEYQRILEVHGGKIADQSKGILLNDPALQQLKAPLEFINENWRDITPGLMNLACQAVGGKAGATDEIALAYSLMNLSFTTFDDLIDDAKYKSFKPTLFGKYEKEITTIVGGVLSAKAFLILKNAALTEEQRQKIDELIWKLWTTIASVESKTVIARKNGKQDSRLKMWKIKSEVFDLGCCLKIGSIIGDGSDYQSTYLEKYGRCLGLILAFNQDFEVSFNSTLELFEKIRTGKCPYCTLWAIENSEHFKSLCLSVKDDVKVDVEFTNSFMESYLESGVIEHCKDLIEKNKKGALRALSKLENNSAVESLRLIISSAPTPEFPLS